jgi:hypothetical protein
VYRPSAPERRTERPLAHRRASTGCTHLPLWVRARAEARDMPPDLGMPTLMR